MIYLVNSKYMVVSFLLLAGIFINDLSYSPSSINGEEGNNSHVERVLDVPYKTQPTNNTCQATCLKMYAMFMKDKLIYGFQNNKSIDDIYSEVNAGSNRPVKARNAWRNFTWWLNREASLPLFELKQTTDKNEAAAHIINSIDNGFPVLLSTNHLRTTGHIILIVGYKDNLSSPTDIENSLQFICHDPFGAFHPSLLSEYYGDKRYELGACKIDGSEDGAGRGVLLDLDHLKRSRADVHNTNQFVMISVQ